MGIGNNGGWYETHTHDPQRRLETPSWLRAAQSRYKRFYFETTQHTCHDTDATHDAVCPSENTVVILHPTIVIYNEHRCHCTIIVMIHDDRPPVGCENSVLSVSQR